DPVADGPIFQEACERALENGITPRKCIQGVRKARASGLEIPIIVTTYYNIPYVFGLDEFARELEVAGVQGLIVPDVPVEEVNELGEVCRERNLDVILQVTPNTSEERLEEIVDVTSGFLYIVNFEGVTGPRKTVSDSTAKLIKTVRKYSDVPLMAGFGVSSGEHARKLVSAGADGVITGSALGEIYTDNKENPEEKLPEIGEFAREIKRGANEGYKEWRSF
ncbi:hypothetical protein AKJ51_05020, partial [candidate division MSBL1 archaeon SCGC-AAA382A20]